MSDKHSYITARNNAWQYLIRHKVRELPVDVFELCRRDKIIMLPYSEERTQRVVDLIGARDVVNRVDGLAIQIKKHPIIFWNDNKPLASQRFTIAHELGHILNLDIGPVPASWNWTPVESWAVKPEEIAADVFALWLLAGSEMIGV